MKEFFNPPQKKGGQWQGEWGSSQTVMSPLMRKFCDSFQNYWFSVINISYRIAFSLNLFCLATKDSTLWHWRKVNLAEDEDKLVIFFLNLEHYVFPRFYYFKVWTTFPIILISYAPLLLVVLTYSQKARLSKCRMRLICDYYTYKLWYFRQWIVIWNFSLLLTTVSEVLNR